jgi:hypothetical protein
MKTSLASLGGQGEELAITNSMFKKMIRVRAITITLQWGSRILRKTNDPKDTGGTSAEGEEIIRDWLGGLGFIS